MLPWLLRKNSIDWAHLPHVAIFKMLPTLSTPLVVNTQKLTHRNHRKLTHPMPNFYLANATTGRLLYQSENNVFRPSSPSSTAQMGTIGSRARSGSRSERTLDAMGTVCDPLEATRGRNTTMGFLA